MHLVNKLVLAAFACCLLAQAAHTAPIAEVDFQTGGVTFSGAPQGWSTIVLHSDNGRLAAENAESLGDFTDKALAPHFLAWTDFSYFDNEPIFAGNVINVSGLSPATGPEFLLSDLSWWLHGGFGGRVDGEIRIVNVPEPAAATMFLAAMAGAIALRGRRGRR